MEKDDVADAEFLAAFETDSYGPAEDGADQPGTNELVSNEVGEEAEEVAQESDEEVSEDMVQPAEEESEAAPQPEAVEEEIPAADVQRAKSWEGRLKAREAELKAKEEELRRKEAELAKKPVDDQPVEQPTEQQVEQAMETVEGMDDDEALKALAEDFGDDFAQTLVKLIDRKASQIAEKAIGDRVGKVDQTVQDLMKGITDDKARSHFEMIQDAHEDFLEIAQSEDLKRWVAGLDGDKAEKAQGVIEGGSARQVIKLLNEYKKSQASAKQATSPVDEAAMTAAEGVRSRGMKIPEKPAISNDYEAAWDQF